MDAYNTITKANLVLINNLLIAKAAVVSGLVTQKAALKKSDDEWVKVEAVNTSEQKAKYITTNTYNIATNCKTDGSLCKKGDKAFDDRALEIANYSTLPGIITAYETERDKYVTAQDVYRKLQLA